MSQHDFDLANQSGAAFRSDLNNALQAIQEKNSGATAPSTTFAYQWWADTTLDVLQQRNAANSAWIIRATLHSDTILAKTGAYTILAADFDKLVNCDASGGAFTITLTVAATATEGFPIHIKNTGATGIVTIDGDGSETIDGHTTIALDPGQGVHLRCDGSNWFTVTDAGEKDAITAAGTDTYTATYGISAYTTRRTYHITFTNANTSTTPTLNLDSVGAKTIKKDGGVALLAGDIPAGHAGILRYDGTDLILMNPLASATNITLGTPVASTSGTAIDFTSIPSGTKRIVIMFDQVSLSGTDNFLIQLGDAGGVETTGYVCGTALIRDGAGVVGNSDTTGLPLFSNNAADSFSGAITISLEDSANNTWAMTGVISSGAGLDMALSSGIKPLSAELDRVRITTDGSNTFDNGEINIQYEG